MKKIVAMVLTLCMALTMLVGCGGAGDDVNETKNQAGQEATQDVKTIATIFFMFFLPSQVSLTYVRVSQLIAA